MDEGFTAASEAIRSGKAKANALWVLLSDEHQRDGYAIRPSPWEGAGEYQHVEFFDARGSVFVRLPDGKHLPKQSG